MEKKPKRAPVPRDHGFPFGMTRREYETAMLAAEGLYNQEIAERFGLKITTIKTHLSKAYRKLGISSRPELRKAMKETAPPVG